MYQRLSETIDFNDADFPDSPEIFRAMDAGIPAVVASDPSLRPKPPHKRRKRTQTTAVDRASRSARASGKAAE